MDGLFCYHLVIMFLATVAILLIWVGFATPGWLVVTFQEDLAAHEYTVSSLNRSLYYDILCPQELKTCEPCEGDQLPNDCIATTYNSTNYNYHYSWVEGLIQDKEEWTAWRVIMTIVVVAALVGWILVLVLVCCLLRPYVYRIVATTAFFLWLAVDQQTIVVVAALVGWILVLVLVCCLLRPYVYRIIATTAFFSWLAVAILVWIPVGMVADMHLDIDDTINDDVPHDATLHVPYSVVLVAVGGFIALITALMLIYLIGICGKNGRSSASRSDTEEIFSEPSKRTPPTLVHDRMYYGPYPYYQPEQQIVYRETAPVKYRYQTPTIVPYTQYPGSVVEEEVLSEYPQYKP